MQPRCSNLIRLLSVLFLAVCATAAQVRAQAPPSLGLQFSAGQPTLSLTGEAGTVYSIQYTTDLSSTNLWEDRTLLQAQGVSSVWSDPSAPTPSQRFYRAVSVPVPVDTNLVFIQPGMFTMGSPTNEAERLSIETQHLVTISRGFWMGKFLVTQGEFLAVEGTNPSHFRGMTLPVESLSWSEVTNYCGRLTQRDRAAERIPTNYAYRLPTESEWEYACRAGTTNAFYLGSSLHSGEANFDGLYEYDALSGTITNLSGINLATTSPVGSYAANDWGLYDMIGNVWEWCHDWYGAYPADRAIDPQGVETGSLRVIRAGDWFGGARNCRSAFRGGNDPSGRSSAIGFRVVLAPGK